MTPEGGLNDANRWIGTSIANSRVDVVPVAAGATMELLPMSTFDNPFDPRRRLERGGCACGRHRSEAEHEYDARRQLQCTPVERESKDERYQGVVASAVMRAVFPKDGARRT